MIRITDKSSHDRRQLLVHAALALAAAWATGFLSFSHADILLPYFGQFHPLPAALMIGLLGDVALLNHHSRSKNLILLPVAAT